MLGGFLLEELGRGLGPSLLRSVPVRSRRGREHRVLEPRRQVLLSAPPRTGAEGVAGPRDGAGAVSGSGDPAEAARRACSVLLQ